MQRRGKEGNQKGRRKRKERQKGKEDLLRVQAQACTICPLRIRRTHIARGNMRDSKTMMSGMKNGNANAITHEATNHFIRFFTCLCIFASQLTNHSTTFMAKKTVSRHK